MFFETTCFDLTKMTEKYYNDFKDNSDWLKMSFHSRIENVRPYEFSSYEEVYNDCKAVNDEILRFAPKDSLAKTTTVHFCLTTKDGVKAMADNGVKGLLGLFGSDEVPRVSYSIDENTAKVIRTGKAVMVDNVYFAPIDIVLNCFTKEEILEKLNALSHREEIRVMIHEQYFYSDYIYYQEDFEEKLSATFEFLKNSGYNSTFFEDQLNEK